MADSCNQCISGTIHAGLPTGTITKIHSLNTYVTGNTTDPESLIIIYSDIFGLNLPNNKLIADAYAARSGGKYLVYLPDFFEGDAAKLEIADLLIPVDASKQSSLSKYSGLLARAPGFLMWMARHKEGRTNKVCMDFLGEVRRDPRFKGVKIGMVGMCWGGRYAMRAGLAGNSIEMDVEGSGEEGGGGKKEKVKVPLVDAVVALHPSNLTLPFDAELPAAPTSYGWGQEDSFVSVELKGKIEGIHDAARAAGKEVAVTEHRVYHPGRHGFAVRGNPEDPAEKKILEDSVTQVMEWFAKWL